MQNHPFIPRHACLTAISCPPTLSLPSVILLYPPSPPLRAARHTLIMRTCPTRRRDRAREICLSISRQPRVNQQPLTSTIRLVAHSFFFSLSRLQGSLNAPRHHRRDRTLRTGNQEGEVR